MNFTILHPGSVILVAKTCKDFKMTVWGMVNHVVPTEHRPPYIDHYR